MFWFFSVFPFLLHSCNIVSEYLYVNHIPWTWQFPLIIYKMCKRKLHALSRLSNPVGRALQGRRTGCRTNSLSTADIKEQFHLLGWEGRRKEEGQKELRVDRKHFHFHILSSKYKAKKWIKVSSFLLYSNNPIISNLGCPLP